MLKLIGVEKGNYYWKRIEYGFTNNNYIFKLGINTLNDQEIFASDERILCSYPGFHFASRSWCTQNYSNRPYEVKIRIPEGAEINEPWATDGKASANMIEIVEIWYKGQNVTEEFKNNTFKEN